LAACLSEGLALGCTTIRWRDRPPSRSVTAASLGEGKAGSDERAVREKRNVRHLMGGTYHKAKYCRRAEPRILSARRGCLSDFVESKSDKKRAVDWGPQMKWRAIS
jgi:hypothetical protein